MKFTRQEDRYIRGNYLTKPIKQICKEMGRSYCGVVGRLKMMGLSVPPEIIEKNKQVGRFKKGNVSFNKGQKMPLAVYRKAKKTMFKRGHLPHNTKYDGALSLRIDKNGTPYWFIRISKAVWVPLARYRWEMYRGKIPHGMILVHKGESTDCRISNLELITRAENMRRNTIHNYPNEIKQSIRTLKKLNKIIGHAEKQN